MVRYSVQCELLYGSLSAAQNVAAELEAFFNKQDASYEYPFTVCSNEIVDNVVTGWVRFATQTNQKALVDKITTLWNSGPTSGRALAGSKIWYHECNNDEDILCLPNTVVTK